MGSGSRVVAAFSAAVVIVGVSLLSARPRRGSTVPGAPTVGVERESVRVPVAAWTTRVESYSGKYKDLPEFRTKVLTLQQYMPPALEEVRSAFQLPPSAAARVSFRLVDILESSTIISMETTSEIAADGPLQVITVGTEPLMTKSSKDIQASLRHEAVHCWTGVLRRVGQPQLPRWIEEGIAVYCAGDGDDVVQRFISSSFSSGESVAEVVAAEQRKMTDGKASYAFVYLAVMWLRDRGGPEILRELLLSADWRPVLSTHCSLTTEEFEAGVRDHVAQTFTRRLIRWESYLAGKRAYGEGRYSEAIHALKEYVEQEPDGVFGSRALFQLGVLSFKRGELAAASDYLERSRKAASGAEVEGGVKYYLFLIACKSGDRVQARALGEVFLRDYSYFSPEYTARVRSEVDELQK